LKICYIVFVRLTVSCVYTYRVLTFSGNISFVIPCFYHCFVCVCYMYY